MGRFLRKRYLVLILLSVGAALLLTQGDGSPRHFATDYPRTASYAIADENTALLRAIAPAEKAHPGQSGFALILKDAEALRMRLEMIAAAERSLDLQYYSIADDDTDRLLIQAILQAAERGVRIRILVDDVTLHKSDRIWALLNNTPEITLRIFNPFATRSQSYLSRVTDLFTDISRFTKRMHNKLFIADNALAIIGGRNLGDAYFGTSQTVNFRDADILAAGPVTQAFSHSFDSFWNGKEAYPFSTVAQSALTQQSALALKKVLAAHWRTETAKPDFMPLAFLTTELANKTLPLIWASAELAADSPDKVEGKDSRNKSVPGTDIRQLLAHAQHDFVAISPYFIPGEGGIALLKDLAARGVQVRVLTNSLASTDVVAVHAGYAGYRQRILETGAQLYEMAPLPGKYPHPGRFSSSTRASLHTKLYIIDGKDIAVGSFNIDPRSQKLNTEVVILIHSSELAEQLLAKLAHVIAPDNSYRVQLIADRSGADHLQWTGEKDGKPIAYASDPPSGFWRPIIARLLAVLPLEHEL